MRSLRSLPPSLWLLIVTLVVVAAFVASSVYASGLARRIDAMAFNISDNADPSIRYLADARTALHDIGSALTGAVLERADRASLRQRLDAIDRRMRDSLDAYNALPYFPTERDRWRAVDGELHAAEAQTQALLALLDAHDVAGAAALRAGPMAMAYARADAALGDLIAFDADQGARLGREITSARRHAQRAAYALDAAAMALAFALGAVAFSSTREHMRAAAEQRRAGERLSDRLRSVAAAAVAISERLAGTGSLREVLQTAVENARTIVDAEMAALGIGTDPKVRFEPFVFDGVDPGVLDAIGAPHPRGLLGVPQREERALRVDDVASDARVAPRPERHPPVGPLLRVTLRRNGRSTGLLYLGRKPGAPPFSEQDEAAIELLAEFLTTAVQNAGLYGSLRDEVRAREDLLSMVSHDLRGPLSAISMAAALAQRRSAEDAPGRRQLAIIANNATRMDRMIGDLLTAARLHEGRLPIETKPQDGGALARDVVDMHAAAAAGKDVRLAFEAADDLPPVLCDAGRVLQCLSNLVSNAIKFTPQGGSVVVRVERSPEKSERELVFIVRDTGSGIPESDLPHVFDRYWQRSRHAALGTGLGLYITKGIVEAHGGRISVTSRQGEGSEFRFSLPAVLVAPKLADA